MEDAEEEEEEEEGEEEWDLMERNEASRVEEQPHHKSRGKVTKPKPPSKPSSTAPTSAFNPTLPSTSSAPSYEALKQQVIEGMRKDLEGREMSREERGRLLESLERFERGGV